MEYGIYKEEDILPYDEIVEECNALKTIASGERENIQYISNGLMDFSDDILNVEGKTPVETFTELVKKMTKHADDIDEFADAIIKKAGAIKTEEEAELARHKKEAEEAEAARKWAEETDKKNAYTNTVPVSNTTAYSSSSSNNTISTSTNTVGNNVCY